MEERCRPANPKSAYLKSNVGVLGSIVCKTFVDVVACQLALIVKTLILLQLNLLSTNIIG